jgi:predicted RNA-binding Zn-ribbon protein involved in translation (DUF1610 family)
MDVVKVEVKYKLGHTIQREFKKTDYFCPNCGKQSIWEEQGGGDYYVGVDYECCSCESVFNMPNMGKANMNDEFSPDKQIIEAIRESEAI